MFSNDKNRPCTQSPRLQGSMGEIEIFRQLTQSGLPKNLGHSWCRGQQSPAQGSLSKKR
jgi:hypothetical protein